MIFDLKFILLRLISIVILSPGYAIFNELHQRGNLHWTDKTCQKALICKVTFSALANAIYQWAQLSGNINQVCTFYEISNGDDVGKPFLTLFFVRAPERRRFSGWSKLLYQI